MTKYEMLSMRYRQRPLHLHYTYIPVSCQAGKENLEMKSMRFRVTDLTEQKPLTHRFAHNKM